MVVQEREREEDDVLAKILRLPASRAQTECRPARALGAGTANLTVEESGARLACVRLEPRSQKQRDREKKPKAETDDLSRRSTILRESYLYLHHKLRRTYHTSEESSSERNQ